MRNPEVTKETILKKAGILFNTQGYKATSISHITESTGFTKGAIYRHFNSKAELERETLGYLSSVLANKLRELIKAQKTAGDKMRAIFGFFESYIANPPLEGGCPLLNAAIEADDAHPELREEANLTLSVLRKSLIQILEKGKENRQIRPEANSGFLATIIIAALEGGIMMSKLAGQDQDIKQVLTHLNALLAEIEL